MSVWIWKIPVTFSRIFRNTSHTKFEDELNSSVSWKFSIQRSTLCWCNLYFPLNWHTGSIWPISVLIFPIIFNIKFFLKKSIFGLFSKWKNETTKIFRNICKQVWFQNRRAKFRRNERSSALNRGVSASREIESTTLPLRPLRVTHSHEQGNNNEATTLQSSQLGQYGYSDYWRSQQHYTAVQTTSSSCHGFVNAANLGNVAFPTYHQTDLHHGLETASSVNGINALRLRGHPYGSSYSAMHASMWRNRSQKENCQSIESEFSV